MQIALVDPVNNGHLPCASYQKNIFRNSKIKCEFFATLFAMVVFCSEDAHLCIINWAFNSHAKIVNFDSPSSSIYC